MKYSFNISVFTAIHINFMSSNTQLFKFIKQNIYCIHYLNVQSSEFVFILWIYLETFKYGIYQWDQNYASDIFLTYEIQQKVIGKLTFQISAISIKIHLRRRKLFFNVKNIRYRIFIKLLKSCFSLFLFTSFSMKNTLNWE